MTFGVLVLGLFVIFRPFGLDVGWLLPFVFSLADPPAQSRVRVWVIRSLFEAQAYQCFVLVLLRPADALFSPERGGAQGTLIRMGYC